jgi:hypothetical protein
MKNLLVLISIITITGCSSPDFWDIKQFKLAPSSLMNGEKVSILYYSNGPSSDETDVKFYTHAIVVSENSKDTLNVLTFPTQEMFKLSKNNLTFHYYNKPNEEKIKNDLKKLPEKVRKLIKNTDSGKVSFAKLKKVFRDPNFDKLANNNFKTVIGKLEKNKRLLTPK